MGIALRSARRHTSNERGSVKLRIVSNGDFGTTRVENAETGEPLDGVSRMTWDLGGPMSMPKATIEVEFVEVDVVGEVA